jgi:protein SCO1/2
MALTGDGQAATTTATGRRWSWPVVLALLLLLGLLSGLAIVLRRAPESTFHGGLYAPPVGLPTTLSLARAAGGRFTTADLRGRLSLVFFGYTTCPDVCPMTLAQVTQTRRLLGERAAQVDVYFVSVDPERDTSERLMTYTRAFDPAIIGLTGTPDELARVMQPFGAIAERRPVADSVLGYLVDHSATIYLIDRQSRLRLVYPPQVTPAELAEDLRRLLAD